jgi:hypothetical protein
VTRLHSFLHTRCTLLWRAASERSFVTLRWAGNSQLCKCKPANSYKEHLQEHLQSARTCNLQPAFGNQHPCNVEAKCAHRLFTEAASVCPDRTSQTNVCPDSTSRLPCSAMLTPSSSHQRDRDRQAARSLHHAINYEQGMLANRHTSTLHNHELTFTALAAEVSPVTTVHTCNRDDVGAITGGGRTLQFDSESGKCI